jgi:hypothetical protein
MILTFALTKRSRVLVPRLEVILFGDDGDSWMLLAQFPLDAIAFTTWN